MPAHFWADLAPFRWTILLAFLDPVVIAIGIWIGWKADQAAKLILAGFAAALAGVTVAFLTRLVGLSWFEGGYAFGGLHAVSRFLAGVVLGRGGLLGPPRPDGLTRCSGSWALIGVRSRRALLNPTGAR